MKKLKKIFCLFCTLILLGGCNSKTAFPKNIDGVQPSSQSDPLESQKVGIPLSTPEAKDSNTLIIGEKMFLTQINDIYFSFDQYKDKTIVVEGMYSVFSSSNESKKASVVYRNGPGCCGNDGWGGFLLKYDGELPNENDWIKVTGTPELVIDGPYQDLYLNVSNIEVMKERGEEFVTQ
ncbi:MAG: hypothetical protein AB9856_17630 [Cellulosilyticaceae bacterium]